MFLPRLAFLLFCAFPAMALSHEFWIEPLDYQVDNGGTLQAYFKNGENFKGSTLSYFDRNSERFELVADGKSTTLSPRSGDSPALDVPAPVDDSLVIVVHETAPSRLTYREWAKFLKFAAHKDFRSAEADHLAAGWPTENFREIYTRHVKALIAVGNGKGQDLAIGLKTEIVALTNPYDAGFDGTMQVEVLFEGNPRPDAQVEVFDRSPDGTVEVMLHRTDDRGVARIPTVAGHDYLFDAVVLQPTIDKGDMPDLPILWETYWAALTFHVPE